MLGGLKMFTSLASQSVFRFDGESVTVPTLINLRTIKMIV